MYSTFVQKGYVVIPGLVAISETLLDDCERVKVMSGTRVMREKDSDIVRRVEGIHDKTPAFLDVERKLRHVIEEQCLERFVLFKDKVNYKGPGCAGFRSHYDGVFHWKQGEHIRNGWFHYASTFVNVLLALDDCTVENGTIEIAPKVIYDSFEDYYEDTMKDGTPHIRPEVSETMHYKPILLNRGDVVIFSPHCPHRSGINTTDVSRRIFYCTYNLASEGDHMEEYILDKFELNGDQLKALQ